MGGWLRHLVGGGGDDADRDEHLAPEVRAARDEVEAALPAGWELHRPDRERYGWYGARVEVWSVAATGPGAELAVGAALEEAAAHRALALRLRGELRTEEGWAPPVGENRRAPALLGQGEPHAAPGMDVEGVVRAELQGLLPSGWRLDRPDRELYPGGRETWGVVAAGPDGALLLAVGRGEPVDAYRQLARLLQADLAVRELWSPY